MRPSQTLLAALITVFTLLGCRSSPPPTRPSQPPITLFNVNPPTCGGGASTPMGTMSGVETRLANLINGLRGQSSLSPGSPNGATTGVAQWHAKDMAAAGAVALVGSDGEDPFRRIVCTSSTHANKLTGVIAVGQGTDPDEVFDVLLEDFSARSLLVSATAFTVLSVGQYNGYWMIILME